MSEFKNLEIICCSRLDTVLYNLPDKRTGRRGRPRIYEDCLKLSAIPLDKPKKRLITWDDVKWLQPYGKTLYTCVTAADPEKPNNFHLSLCTTASEGIAAEPAKQADKKLQL